MEITNTTKVRQTTSYVRVYKANKLKIKLSQSLHFGQSANSKWYGVRYLYENSLQIPYFKAPGWKSV